MHRPAMNLVLSALSMGVMFPHSGVIPSRYHGYRPHPNAFRRRPKRAPYKGNLGPRR